MTAAIGVLPASPEDTGGGLVELSLADPRWLEHAAACPDAGPFHHPAWAQLLADCYGFRALALAGIEDDRVATGLPLVEISGRLGRSRRWVSLPFTDYCRPLAGVDRPQLTAALLAAAADAGVSRVEVRSELDGADVHSSIEAYRHTLALDPGPERLFASFRKSRVQRAIRQGEGFVADGSLVVRRAESEDDLAGVFYGLHLNTRRRLGVPVQPQRFFRLLWERMLEPGLGFALLAYAEGRPAAGAVFLAWGKTMVYKFGASEREFQRLRPNHVLFWNAIREGCESGFELFDWGRTDLDGESLREFKLGWGTVEEPLVYSSLGGEAQRAGDGRAAKALGAVIRRSPGWVCRASGELLYKHAA